MKLGCYYDSPSEIHILSTNTLVESYSNLKGRLRAVLGTMWVVMESFGDLVQSEGRAFVFMILEENIKHSPANGIRKPFQDNTALNGFYGSAHLFSQESLLLRLKITNSNKYKSWIIIQYS